MTETLVKTARYWCWCAVAMCSPSHALAETASEDVPDAEFLEYLGMWDETDEDWLALEDIALADINERNDPVLESEESTEIEDEN